MTAKIHKKFGLRLLGAGASLIAVSAGAQAHATCTVAGSGTLANLGPNATATCTNQTQNVTIGSASNAVSNVIVVVDENSQIVPTSSITLGGGGDTLTVTGASSSTNSAGTISNVSISLTGDNARVIVGGSQSTGGQIVNSSGSLFSLSGANALLEIQQNGIVTTTQAIQLAGANSQLRLSGGALASALPSYTGLLVQGGSGANTFDIGGEVAGRQAAGLVQTIDGGGGADTFIFSDATRFTELNNTNNTAFRFDGGLGADILNLTGENTTLARFNTTGIETLNKTGGGRFLLEGTHDFTDINVTGAGAILEVTGGLDSLGAANAAINIDTGANLILNQSTAGTLTQSLSGAGTFFKNGAGTLTIAQANSGFSGLFNISSGAATITDANALGTAAITLNGTLNVGDITLANSITGGGGTVIKSGAGVTTLGGVNVHGDTRVDAGRLNAIGVTALGRGAVTLAAGSILEINQATNATGNGIIVGAGALVKSGSGDLTFTNAGCCNLTAFSGGTSITGGRLILGASSSGAGLGAGDITISSGAAFQLGAHTVANAITGAGAVEKGSTGVGILTGANTHSGGTNVLAGTLQTTSAAPLGSGAVNISGGATFNLANAGTMSFANALAGAGTFDKTGAGDLILSAANSGLTGTTRISAGRIILNNGSALGTSAVVNDAQLRLGDVSVGNVISGSGSVEKTSSGVGTLSGVNTYTGGTSIADGTLRVTGTTALGTGAVSVAGGATLNFDHATSGSVSGAITGAGNVTKTGAGTTTLSGANTFSGGASVQQGSLEVTTGAALGTGTVAVASGASLRFNNTADTQLANIISGAGGLVKAGAGTVEILTTNTYAGGTDIQQGAIRVTDIAQLGTGAISVQSGAALDFSIAGNATLNQTISGAGLMRKSNTGELTLLGNSLSGGLDIAQGQVRVTDSSALGTGGVTASSGATLAIENASTDAFSTSYSGAGALTKAGGGDLILSGQNDYSGGTTISDGRVILNNGSGLGSGAVLNNAALRIGNVAVLNAISGTGTLEKTSSGLGVLAGANTFTGGTTVAAGTLRADGSAALGTGTVAIASGATLNINATTANQMANVLSGDGAFVKSGAGDLALNGSAAARTGSTTISAGRLIVNRGDALGTGAVVNNASLRLGDIALANVISGTGSVEKTSSGVGTLSGVNTYTGGTLVSAGTLRTTAPSSLGTGALSVASGATFEFDTATDAVFGLGGSGAGTFRKLGAGALTFSNPFSIGTLAVNGGRVRVNTTLTGSATVAVGATLDGTGTISGSVTNGGTLAPGNSIGILSVGGDFTQSSGGVLEIEFDTTGNRMDLLQVGGRANLGGTVRFISTDATEAFGGTFLNANGGISGQFDSVEIQGASLPVTVLYGSSTGAVAPTVLSARPSTFNSQLLAASDTSFAFIEGVAGRRDHTVARNGWWADTFAAEGERNAHASTLGYSHSSNGFAMGGAAETKAPGLSLGGAIGWADSDIDLDEQAGGGTQKSVMLGAYLSYKSGPTRWTGGLFLGGAEQDTVRNVSFNSVTTSITGETTSGLFGAFGSLDQELGAWADWSFSGKLNADYVQQTQDAYVENGSSPLRLSVRERGFDTYQVEALVEGERSFDLGNGQTVTPRFGVGVGQTIAGGSRIIPVEFAASGASVALQGDTREITQAITNASVAWQISGNAALTFDYNGRLGDASSHLGRVGVAFQF